MAKKSLREIFSNPTSWMVLAVVVGAALLAAYCEDANADTAIEEKHDSTGGISSFNRGLDRLCGRQIFDTGTSFFVCPIVAVGGDVDWGSFELGFADTFFERWEGEIQIGYFENETYGGVTGRRVFGDGPFHIFIGVTAWVSESPGSNSDVTYNLGLRYVWR